MGAGAVGDAHALRWRLLEDPEPLGRIGITSAWRPRRTAARAIACRPVPWASELTHGGRWPSNGNRYSHASPPARREASGSASVCSASVLVLLRLLLPSALSVPNVPSHWIWMPWPAYSCHTSWDGGNVTRAPLEISGRVVQYSVLRCSVRNSGGMRVA